MTHADGIRRQFEMAADDDDLPLELRNSMKRRLAEMDDAEPPTAEDLMDAFGYEPDDVPNPIHDAERYGYPYIHIGSRQSYHARKIWQDKLDREGFRWHHPEDDRFSEGVDVRTAIVTGRTEAGD